MCKQRAAQKRGVSMLETALAVMLAMLAASLFLTMSIQYQPLLQKMQLETAAMTLVQDLYRVQTKNTNSDGQFVLHVGQGKGEYSIRSATAIVCERRFAGVRFSSLPLSFTYSRDGAPREGGSVFVNADDQSASWCVTVLPVTGRIAVRRR